MFSRAKNVKVRVFPLFRGDAMNKRSLEHFIIEYFKDEDIQDFKIGEMIYVKVEKIEPAEALHTDRHTRLDLTVQEDGMDVEKFGFVKRRRREHRRIADLLRPGQGLPQTVPGRQGALEEECFSAVSPEPARRFSPMSCWRTPSNADSRPIRSRHRCSSGSTSATPSGWSIRSSGPWARTACCSSTTAT